MQVGSRRRRLSLRRWRRLGGARHAILCVAPVGLLFLSFLPSWLLARALAHVLAIPEGSPVIEHPYGIVWLASYLSAMLALMGSGFALGTLLNVLFARRVLGWRWSDILDEGIGDKLFMPYVTDRAEDEACQVGDRSEGYRPMGDA